MKKKNIMKGVYLLLIVFMFSSVVLATDTSDLPTYTTKQINNVIRNKMKNRVPVFSFKLSDVNDYYFNESSVYEHTGVPTEGEYLDNHTNFNCNSYYDGDEKYYTCKFSYVTSKEQEKEVDAELKKVMNSLALSGSDYNKITKIYKWIINNVNYYNYDEQDYGFKSSVYSALINKTADSKGYAMLFYRMALEAGIDARVVYGTQDVQVDYASGYTKSAYWNRVKIGNYYYNVDAVADTGKSKPEYFLKGRVFKDHTMFSDNNNEYIVSSKKYPISIVDYDERTYRENAKLQLKLNKNTKIWEVFNNGKLDKKYTGMVTNNNGTFYANKGVVSLKYNGTYSDYLGNIYILKKSKVDTTYTGLKYAKKWYYFTKGKTNFKYNGLATNKNGTYYVNNGIITFKHNELVKYNGKWNAVVNSRLSSTYTGLSTNKNGTFYLENGILTFKYNGNYIDYKNDTIYLIKKSKVDTTYTGLKYVNKKWYYFTKGVLDKEYRGIAKNNNGLYYVENGEIDFYYSGEYQSNDGSRYKLSDGKVDTTFTGLGNYFGETYYYYYKNGKTDYTYTGLVDENGSTYYVKNGKADRSYSGIVTVNKKKYYINNGTVIKYGIYKDKNGNMYKIDNNKLDTTYTGVYSNNYGYYYFKKGKTDYTYTGLADGYSSTYYVKDGKADTSYSGIVTVNKKKYYINNGTVIKNGIYTDKDENMYKIDNNKLDTTYTGVYSTNYGYYYFKKGKTDFSFMGMVKTRDSYSSYYYVKNGKVNETYTGVVAIDNEKYYVERGYIYSNKSQLVKYNGKWTAVVNGRVDSTYTGILSNDNGAFLLENGIISFKYKGTYEDKDGSLYIMKNSKVDTSVNGLKWAYNGEYSYLYYFKNGKVDTTYTGAKKASNGTVYYVTKGQVTFDYDGEGNTYNESYYNAQSYMFKNSKVDTSYTGVSYGYNKGEYEEWYFKNGVIDTTYTGVVECQYGDDYYVIKGKVNEQYDRLIKYNGKWTAVVNGRVKKYYTGLSTNNNGTFYLENGEISFKYNGIYEDAGNIYKITKSKVDTAYNGLKYVNKRWLYFYKGRTDYAYNGVASNAKGELYYVEDGEVTLNYNGTVDYNGKTYIVKDSKLVI